MSNASDLATRPERRGLPTPDRFERLGYGPKHQRKPLKELDLRSQLMLEYMLIGCRHKDTCDRIGVEVNEPMSQQQASDAVGLRRRNGRFIFGQAIFQKALAKGLDELRSGHRVKAIVTQAEIMRDKGDGSAAFAATRLKAASALLGDENRNGPSVAVQINNNAINLSPGVVIRLPASAPVAPLELQANEEAHQHEQPAIEHDDVIRLDPRAAETMHRHWPATTGSGNE